MKLISVLRVMDDNELVEVIDENAPITEMSLFSGTVKECKNQGYFRNGVVTQLAATNDVLSVFVDIEYQKRNAEREG